MSAKTVDIFRSKYGYGFTLSGNIHFLFKTIDCLTKKNLKLLILS